MTFKRKTNGEIMADLYKNPERAEFLPFEDFLARLFEPGERTVSGFSIHAPEDEHSRHHYRVEVVKQDQKSFGTGITFYDALYMAKAKVDQAIVERDRKYAEERNKKK